MASADHRKHKSLGIDRSPSNCVGENADVFVSGKVADQHIRFGRTELIRSYFIPAKTCLRDVECLGPLTVAVSYCY